MLTRAFCLQRNDNLRRSRSLRPRLEAIEPRTLLSAISWTGAAGDNNWDTPTNWDSNSVPRSADDVTIDVAANVVHSDDVTDSINSLTSTEPLTISGGTLSIAAASTIDSTLTITGGTLTGTGDLTVGDLVTLTGGTLRGPSALDANGGILINPANSQFDLDGRTVNNAAGQTTTWTGQFSNVEASNGSIFNNQGTFVIDALGGYEDSGTGSPSTFNNAGSLTISGTGNVGFDIQFNVPGGNVDVETGGRLDLYGGGSATGAVFQVDGSLGFDRTQFLLDTATTITGAGEIDSSAGSLTLPGNYAFMGSLEILHGNLLLDGSMPGASVIFSDTSDGFLSGTGTVGAIQVGGLVLSPGAGSHPGIFTAEGDVTLVNIANDDPENGSVLNFLLQGPDAGSGYSQLDVNGQVDLGGGELDAGLEFSPDDGEQFTIIKSTKPIVGTFDGLPEGATLTIDDAPFTISYVGGDGNDVVLTYGIPAPPQVTGLSPNSGPETGGTPVTITGSGFTGATEVDFGTAAATNLTVVNATTIECDSPAGSGTADVTVITPQGTSPTSAADEFTYTATTLPAPTVTGVSPDDGPASGGTLVTISGTGFTGATVVHFGTTAATNLAVVNATTIQCDSPPGSGIADVTVITSQGTSPTSAADEFTYTATTLPAPTVTGVSPDDGPAAGGTLVTITGTGFTGATEVDFGTTPAANVIVSSANTITATSPAGTGTVNITVVTPGGTSATRAADQFTYIAAAPRVMSVARFGFHMQPTSVVLTFSSALDPTEAQDVKNYRIVTLGGRGRNGFRIGHVTRVRAAVYDPAAFTVTLRPVVRLDIHNRYRLTVKGAMPTGLRGGSGVPLAGEADGAAGTNYVTVLREKLVAGPAPRVLPTARKKPAARRQGGSHD
jgi:IPT/TIG domain